MRENKWKLAAPWLCALMLLAPGRAVLAQGYPAKPIRFVIAFSPGGAADVPGRMIAQELGKALGHQVIVDNRPGAGGGLGAEAVAKAPPDGHTLLMVSNTHAISRSLYKKQGYDLVRDLAPVMQIAAAPNVLVVHPSLPARSVKQLVALARARPDSLVIGSPGQGTSPHLSAELFNIMTGVKMTQVQYKGAGQGMIGLLSGEVAVMFPTTPTVMPYLKAGRLRPLGVTTANRTAALPDVPSIAEAGVAGYESTQWFGILAPAGTPRPIIDRLNTEIARIMQSLKERLTGEGMDVVTGTPEQFAAHIKAETEKWAKVIKSMGIKLQ